MKKIMHFIMLSCLKATQLIEKKLVVKLKITEIIQLKLHKMVCSSCRRYEVHSKLIDEAIENNPILPPQIDLSKFINDLKIKFDDKA